MAVEKARIDAGGIDTAYLVAGPSDASPVVLIHGSGPGVSAAANWRLTIPALADPDTVTVPDPDRVVVLTQTTLSVDDTMKTIDILRKRFPDLVVPTRDDLCYATKNRQDAVRRIAHEVDLFLVVTRIGTMTPWSSKATDIARSCGLTRVLRIERGVFHGITGLPGGRAALQGDAAVELRARVQAAVDAGESLHRIELLHDHLTLRQPDDRNGHRHADEQHEALRHQSDDTGHRRHQRVLDLLEGGLHRLCRHVLQGCLGRRGRRRCGGFRDRLRNGHGRRSRRLPPWSRPGSPRRRCGRLPLPRPRPPRRWEAPPAQARPPPPRRRGR